MSDASIGRNIGLQLRCWLQQEPELLRSGTAIANRLIDALGADDSLRGPIRDLTSRPLLVQALLTQGASRKAALAGLNQQLAQTYTPAVLNELLGLLEAATGEKIDNQVPESLAAAAEDGNEGDTTVGSHTWHHLLQDIAPGAALAASAALVLSWVAEELDRAVFDGWGWSGGVVLVVVLGLLQALSLGPLKPLRRNWPLSDSQAVQPRQAWRWIGSGWLHANGLEAGLNLVLLLLLLGASPLPLAAVVLRYGLTVLACLVPAVLVAQLCDVRRCWSGASGPLSALIALAAGLSLLHWRPMTFATPLATIPAWVLLLLYSALQLSWQLPRHPGDHHTTPLQRLLSSSWGWGLILGLGWAIITRIRELL